MTFTAKQTSLTVFITEQAHDTEKEGVRRTLGGAKEKTASAAKRARVREVDGYRIGVRVLSATKYTTGY